MSCIKKNIVKKISAGGVVYYKGKYLVIKWGSEKKQNFQRAQLNQAKIPSRLASESLRKKPDIMLRLLLRSL